MTTLETLPKDILLDILALVSPEHDLYPTIPRVSPFFYTLSRETASLWERLLQRDFHILPQHASSMNGTVLRQHYRVWKCLFNKATNILDCTGSAERSSLHQEYNLLEEFLRSSYLKHIDVRIYEATYFREDSQHFFCRVVYAAASLFPRNTVYVIEYTFEKVKELKRRLSFLLHDSSISWTHEIEGEDGMRVETLELPNEARIKIYYSSVALDRVCLRKGITWAQAFVGVQSQPSFVFVNELQVPPERLSCFDPEDRMLYLYDHFCIPGLFLEEFVKKGYRICRIGRRMRSDMDGVVEIISNDFRGSRD